MSRETTGRSSSAWAGRSHPWSEVCWSGASGNPRDVGSLALAEYRGTGLEYVGHAGSGLSTVMRNQLAKDLAKLARKTCPLATVPETKKPTHWLRPSLVIEAGYTEYTPYGHLRHPTVLRVRDDKRPQECITCAFGASRIAYTPFPYLGYVHAGDKVFSIHPDLNTALAQ